MSPKLSARRSVTAVRPEPVVNPLKKPVIRKDTGFFHGYKETSYRDQSGAAFWRLLGNEKFFDSIITVYRKGAQSYAFYFTNKEMTEVINEREVWYLWARIHSRIGGIALSYFATLEKIEEMTQVKWQDDTLSRFANKGRMKELGNATIQYSVFLHENSILALAKAVEDVSVELKKDVNFRFDPVVNHHNVIYQKELQTIRALANVIKHNVSRLERKDSKSAKFLIDECGLKNGEPLDDLIFLP